VTSPLLAHALPLAVPPRSEFPALTLDLATVLPPR